MSADNFIAIVKKGRSYIGYECSASQDYPHVMCFPCLGQKRFKETSLRRAIDLAQARNTEYGYSLYNWVNEVLKTWACPCKTRRFIDRFK